MAKELNFTKEELEAYRDKLARTKDIRDSLIKAANAKSLSGLYLINIKIYRLYILLEAINLKTNAYYLNICSPT